ncbi:ClpXP protease specificity-enhancing factor SspB [Candidatus Bandiella euplotis]|nr:ClpXP protease specificity-enhancing factor SspB [Candidatus Bandiella woodruffii]
MYYIVREALRIVENHGLSGNHHFYITCQTNYAGVEIPIKLKTLYPEEITIVIQHDFRNLTVFEDYFQIELSFGGKYSKLVIPFKAIISFADPSEMFLLEFNQETSDNEVQEHADHDSSISLKENHTINNIISLDQLRKSKK